MIVKCISKDASNLTKNYYDIGYSQATQFTKLDVGNLYKVMGIVVYQNAIFYLLPFEFDSYKTSDWEPAILFEIVDHTLSSSWHFKFYDKEAEEKHGRSAIWGYKELVHDENHYEELINMEGNTLDILFNRISQM